MNEAIDAHIGRIAAAEADGMQLLVERRAEPGGAWFRVSELLKSNSAPAVLLSRVRGMTEVPADHIRAEWLFESYVRVLGELGASFLLHRQAARSGGRQSADGKPQRVDCRDRAALDRDG